MRFAWTEEWVAVVASLRASGLNGILLLAEMRKRTGYQALTLSAIEHAERRARMNAQAPEAILYQRPALVKEPSPVQQEPLSEPPGHDPLADTQESEPISFDSEPQSPAVHTSKSRGEAYLVVSDTQEPYSAAGALPFVLAVAKEYGVDLTQPGSAYHVGDEIDAYAFSRFLRSPDAPHTAKQELEAVRERLRRWYRAIPHMRLCTSNHGERILRRAEDAGLPSDVLRSHREILEAPEGWQWRRTWRVDGSREKFMVEHGHHGGQSMTAARQRPAFNGISTIWGHMHAQACVVHVRTMGQQVYGMCVGSLIDREAIAFAYSKPNTWQPWLGVGVVLNGGKTPLLVPLGSL